MMKYFSVSFIPQKDDVPKQKFPLDLSLLQNPATVMRLFITIGFTAVMWFMGDTSVALFMLVSFLVMPFVANSIYRYSFISSTHKGKMIKRPVTVEFYADHLVYVLESDFNYKGIFQRHYGFDSLQQIYDFPGVFIFLFKNEGGVTIPKRAMNEDQISMVYNLVDNLFKNKYIKMK